MWSALSPGDLEGAHNQTQRIRISHGLLYLHNCFRAVNLEFCQATDITKLLTILEDMLPDTSYKRLTTVEVKWKWKREPVSWVFFL